MPFLVCLFCQPLFAVFFLFFELLDEFVLFCKLLFAAFLLLLELLDAPILFYKLLFDGFFLSLELLDALVLFAQLLLAALNFLPLLFKLLPVRVSCFASPCFKAWISC